MPSGNPTVRCAAVLFKRGSVLEGKRLDDDILCDNAATTDVIVTFNGKRYVVPLCSEHKAHHDQAAADRRAQRSGSHRRDLEKETNDRRVKYVREHAVTR